MPRVLPSHTRRLSELVNRPGGITVDEAVQAAEARLETIRDSSLHEISQMLDRMQAIGQALAGGRKLGECNELYTISNALVGIAGVFGMPQLGEVAFSLCTLLDRQRLSSTWSMPAVQLHLDSLRLMHSGGADEASMRAVNAALRQVVDKVPPAVHAKPLN